MLSFAYPAVLERVSGDEVIVRFPDFPEALTGGRNEAEALALAADALEEAVLARLARDAPIPDPRATVAGEVLVTLDLVTAARAVFARTLVARKLTKVAAAKLANLDERQVRRILDGRGKVRMESVLEALRALDVRPALMAV